MMPHKRFEVSSMHHAIKKGYCCFSAFKTSNRLNINRTRFIPASYSTDSILEASIAGSVRGLQGVPPLDFLLSTSAGKKGREDG